MNGEARRIRVLFFLRGIHYGRVFENFLRALLERGHDVHVALVLEKRRLGPDKASLFEELRRAFPSFSYEQLGRRTEAWLIPAIALRHGLDYLRYLEPEFAHAGPLRKRARSRAPVVVRGLVVFPFCGSAGRRMLSRLLRGVEAAIPIPKEIRREIDRQAPDVVLVSPLVGLGSIESDYIRAAAAAGIPTVLPVASWDNLTNKGLLRDVPTLTIVWNQAQVEEAVHLHKLPANQVRAVGAHSFDHWFGWQPSTTREEFANRLGIDPDRRLVLYLGSSHFISGNETIFIRDWLSRVRGHPRLSNVAVILRPHPQNIVGWAELDADDPGRVVVWPRAGEAPTDRAKKADYFDCLYYSSAVVGINTSAQVEASIVGRPVLTLISDYFRTQDGTLHFSRIAHGENGGVVTVARSWEEHLDHVADAIEAPDAYQERIRTFVENFVGPNGLQGSAAPVAAQAVEAAASTPVARSGGPPLLRPFLIAFTPVLPMLFALRHPRRAWARLRKSGRRITRRILRITRRILHITRVRWKYAKRRTRTVYNWRYRFTYRWTIARVPSRNEIPELLNARELLGDGAEIGVKTGRFSRHLLRRWRGRRLLSVDPWLSVSQDEYLDRSNVSQEEFDEYYAATKELLAAFGSRSEIWRMTSLEAAARIPDRSLDFVYIDARHDYESVQEDIAAWFPKVRPGGIVAGHDYADGSLPQGDFGVKSAVDEFFGARRIPVHVTQGPSAVELFPSWIVEKPGEGTGSPAGMPPRRAFKPAASDADRAARWPTPLPDDGETGILKVTF